MEPITPKAARVNRSMSQSEMAKILGISLSSLQNKENGRTQFTKEESEKYSKAVGMPEEDIDFVWFDRNRK